MVKPAAKKPAHGISHLRVNISPEAYIGPGRADLLEYIAETHAIGAAGRRMGMSYKRAWGLVQTLNATFSAPLVTTSRGGSDQGGAELTELGLKVLAAYRRMQKSAAKAIGPDIDALQKILSAARQKL